MEDPREPNQRIWEQSESALSPLKETDWAIVSAKFTKMTQRSSEMPCKHRRDFFPKVCIVGYKEK